MALKKISAIFSSLKLDKVEEALLQHGAKGFTVHEVKGRGAYFDSYNLDPLTPQTLVEVYTSEANVATIILAICEAACLGFNHGGLVSILPVEELYWINEGRCCQDSDFETGQSNTD